MPQQAKGSLSAPQVYAHRHCPKESCGSGAWTPRCEVLAFPSVSICGTFSAPGLSFSRLKMNQMLLKGPANCHMLRSWFWILDAKMQSFSFCDLWILAIDFKILESCDPCILQCLLEYRFHEDINFCPSMHALLQVRVQHSQHLTSINIGWMTDPLPVLPSAMVSSPCPHSGWSLYPEMWPANQWCTNSGPAGNKFAL